jgi:hypothetical protein
MFKVIIIIDRIRKAKSILGTLGETLFLDLAVQILIVKKLGEPKRKKGVRVAINKLLNIRYLV